MSLFDRLARTASRSVDRVNAVPASWRPMDRSPNGRARADPVRPPAKITGVFDLRQRDAGIQQGNREPRGGNDFRLQRNSPAVEFSLDTQQLQGRSAPRQGDRLTIRDVTYEISTTAPDGHGRLVCSLVTA